MCVCVCVCVCKYLYMYVCIYVCIYVCSMYVYTHSVWQAKKYINTCFDHAKEYGKQK